MANEKQHSDRILNEQKKYLQKLAERADSDPTRLCIYLPGGTNLQEVHGIRNKGRPREKWIKNVLT